MKGRRIKELSVGIIGLGLIGSRYLRVFCENLRPGSVAVHDLDEGKAERLARQYDVKPYASAEAMLEQARPDLAIVATPDHAHERPVKLALEANAHVLVEKPLATDLRAATEMVELAEARGLTLMVNYSQRQVTEYRWIKSQIDAGRIGKPIMVTSLRYDTITVPTGMLAWADHTSPLFFMTSHDLDLTCWYLDARPVEVYAQEVREGLQGKGIEAHDGAHAVVKFDSGATAMFHSSWILPDTYPTVAGGSMDIVGTQGFIAYSMVDRKVAMYTADWSQEIQFGGPHTADVKGGKLAGAFVRSVQSFIQAAIAGGEADTSARKTLHVTQAQCAMNRSIQENAIVRL